MGLLSTRLSTAISGCWHKDKNPFPRGGKFREIIRERFLCGEKLAGFCKALELTEISSFSDSWKGQAASGDSPSGWISYAQYSLPVFFSRHVQIQPLTHRPKNFLQGGNGRVRSGLLPFLDLLIADPAFPASSSKVIPADRRVFFTRIGLATLGSGSIP